MTGMCHLWILWHKKSLYLYNIAWMRDRDSRACGCSCVHLETCLIRTRLEPIFYLDIEERPDEPQRLVDSNHTLVRIAWAMERLWEPHRSCLETKACSVRSDMRHEVRVCLSQRRRRTAPRRKTLNAPC
jgi:hypothetical protein